MLCTFIRANEEIEGEEIPVLQFSPNDGWTHILDEDGAQVWFYENVVPEGGSFTPLFSEWTMTNFRIANNMSGLTPIRTEFDQRGIDLVIHPIRLLQVGCAFDRHRPVVIGA